LLNEWPVPSAPLEKSPCFISLHTHTIFKIRHLYTLIKLFNLNVRLFSTKKHRKCKDKKIHFKIFFHKNYIFFFKNPKKTLTTFCKSLLHSMMDDFGSLVIFCNAVQFKFGGICNAAGTMAISKVQRPDR